MTDLAVTTAGDWASDQEVRWCPGCGDYGILKAVQMLMPELGGSPENTVFISGIGCAARFPYYMNTYGMHSIHGRAPAIATGLAMARDDLDVWVVGGDGDMLSIGGNHLIHALRRNVNLTILLFNNQIYGLTKGQYSPTSEIGKVTKSTPFGSLDQPFNPVSVALGRRGDVRGPHPRHGSQAHDRDVPPGPRAPWRGARRDLPELQRVQRRRVRDDHEPGQNRDDMLIPLVHGEPIRFGADLEKGVMVDGQGRALIVDVADVGEDAILVHDEAREEPGLAFMLSRLAPGPTAPTPIGVFRAVERADYGTPDQPSARRRPDRRRSRRPRRRCSTAGPPGRSADGRSRSPVAPPRRATPEPDLNPRWESARDRQDSRRAPVRVEARRRRDRRARRQRRLDGVEPAARRHPGGARRRALPAGAAADDRLVDRRRRLRAVPAERAVPADRPHPRARRRRAGPARPHRGVRRAADVRGVRDRRLRLLRHRPAGGRPGAAARRTWRLGVGIGGPAARGLCLRRAARSDPAAEQLVRAHPAAPHAARGVLDGDLATGGRRVPAAVRRHLGRALDPAGRAPCASPRTWTASAPPAGTAPEASAAPGGACSGTRCPVFGFGWKNVVLAGIRSPVCALAAIWATVAGRSRMPASASPDTTAACTRSVPCWYTTSWAGRPASACATRALSRSATPANVSGSGCSSVAEPSGPTTAIASASVMAASTAPSATSATVAEPARAEAATLEGGREVGAGGQTAHQAMDRADRQLVVDQLDHEHHRGVGRAAGALVGPTLVPVGERGLVAVVAVGDHHRRRADRRADRLDLVGFVDPPDRVLDAVVVGPARERWGVGPQQVGEALRRATAPRSARGWRTCPAGGRAGRSWPSGWSPRGGGSRPRRAGRGRARR